MRRWLLPLVALVGLLALGACAAKEEAKPAPGAPAGAPMAPAAKPAWQEEWDRVLAAAKQEGKVAIMGGGREARLRVAISKPFERKYGITVEVLPTPGSQAAPRIRAERQGGQYLWDAYVGGFGSQVFVRDLGVLEPIEPVLILPEVKEPKNWYQGRLQIVDKNRQIIFFSMRSSEAFAINTSLAKPQEFRSYRDLLDPKWKGRIMAIDPTAVGGPTQSRFHHFYVHKDLGPDFIRALAKQDLILLRDEGVALEWLGQGKHPILLGGATGRLLEVKEKGLPIEVVDGRQLKEGTYMSWGPGGVAMFNRAPHPNAAKLYINWLLSREAQTEFSKVGQTVSLRGDVPSDHVHPLMLPQEAFINIEGSDERLVERRQTVIPFLREVFGK